MLLARWFTVKEIEHVFGEEKIRGMFFRGHVEGIDGLDNGRGDPAKHPPS